MRKKIIFLLIMVLAAPMGFKPVDAAVNESAIYQNGTNGYLGTEDATISNQYIEWNENGETNTVDQLRSYIKTEAGKSAYEKRALIKFTDLGLPDNAKVTSASLSLTITDWESGLNGMPQTILRGYYFKTPWNINASNLGWIYRDDPDNGWSAPGANGSGDIISGKSFTITGLNSSGDQTKIVNLDNEVVQSWIDDSSTNNGVIIINETGDGAGTASIHSSEDADKNLRPKLQITYTVEDSTPVSQADPIIVETQIQTSEVLANNVDEEEPVNQNSAEDRMPTVYISSPQNNATYQAPAEINFTAMAEDTDGTISKVEFYHGTTKVGEDTMEPYLLRLQGVSAGEYHFSAVATDNDGNQTGSSAIRLIVEGGNQPPSVYISSPQNNATYQAPAEINFTAMAEDTDGTISKVEFYHGTTKVGEDTMEPYLLRLQGVSVGEYHFSAIATDDKGTRTGSEAIRITVVGGNNPPTVSITSPANNSEFTSPANILIQASAQDSDGSINNVEFYRGTTKIGEDSSAPYSFNWLNVGAGEYHISAVAIDNNGAKTGSEALRLLVGEPAQPQSPSEPQTPASQTVGVDMVMCENATIPAGAKYVSISGNDSTADGSINNPYRTVRAAVTEASAGDTIVLRGGRYVEPSEVRIRVPNITIMSYPGEWAIIDRSSDMEDIGVYFYVGSDGGALKCAEVIGGFYAVSTETKWDWGDPNDRMGASNILLENVKLHDSHRDVVKIKPQSDDITIRHAEIYNSGTNLTPGECNAEGIDNVNGDRMHVSYSYIHDTCSTGVYFKGGATDGVVEHNLIENTGAAGIILGFDTSPEYFDLTTNPDYYENIRGIARHNLIRNTGWGGVALYASKDAQVYNNTIVNSASIYHSPIYFGITFQDWMPEAGRPANINPVIHHNIVYQPAERNAHMISIRQSNELGGLSALDGNLNINNNCYYQAGGSATFEDSRTQVDQGGWTDDWTGNLAEWRAHINGDANSLESNPNLDSNYKPTNALCIGRGY